MGRLLPRAVCVDLGIASWHLAVFKTTEQGRPYLVWQSSS